MLPSNPADAWWVWWPDPLYVWRAPEHFQRVRHASRDDFPGTFLYELPAHRPSYRTSDTAGVSMESDFHDLVIERPTPRESRRFFLDRSVYDLVAAYPHLTLTDHRLLGWYRNLSPQDRKLIQDEGGFFQFLQRHPALELYGHQIYVKCGTSPTQPAITANQQVSITAGAEVMCETPNIHLDLEIVTSSVRENLALLGRSSNGNRRQEKLRGQQAHIPDGFHTGCSFSGTDETNQMAHYAPLNEERYSGPTGSSAALCEDPAGLPSFSLDMELERHRQRRKPEPRSQISMPQGQNADFSPSQSDWSMGTKESPSECSYQMAGPAYTDRSINQAAELAQATLSQTEANATKHVCQEKDLHGTKYTADDDTLAAGTETSEACQCATTVKTAEKHTSCDAMVGTELVLCPSVFTQTKDPETADKHSNTEVYMADLDYLTKEFIKLKKVQEVKKERKEKTKSVGCKLRGERECLERAELAELALLALQYSICKQHCWRLYYTSAEGNQLALVPKDPPPNITRVLQKLELDYNEMKSKIQAGVPLQQLKPLSVDTGEFVTGGNYIPAQIICEVLGEASSWSSQEPQKLSGGGAGRPDNHSREVLQEEQKWLKKENEKTRRAATPFPQHEASVGQEVNTGEKWYDAEEDLEPPGDAVAAAVTQDPTLVTADTSDESAREEAKSSVLCVSNLPISVTESDVMLLLDKYQPSEVSISALKDLRFAIVMLSGPECADAAVRELSGCPMQGCTLHLKHIGGAGSGSQASARGPDSSQHAAKPQTSEMDTESRLITQPLVRPSIRSRKVVCISPTAKGSFVPQNYGTMSGFETLMAELTQLHPQVGRQRIVAALIELRAKHQGVLCGLPLRTIQEMISDLLTGPQAAKQF